MKLLIISALMSYFSFGSSANVKSAELDDVCTVNFTGSQGTFSCTASTCAIAFDCARRMFDTRNDI